MSGVAATSIGGETIHSAAAFNRKIAEDDMSWANARLLIIDEISFMNVKECERLDENLRVLLRKHNALFGGIHIIFSGDFRQLEPVTGRPLYSSSVTDRKWANSINCYIELKGLHRFKDDPEWGKILERIRNDQYTQHDIDSINECVIGSGEKTGYGDISYCVYNNTDRTAINTGIFDNTLKAHWKTFNAQPTHMVVVKAGAMQRQRKGKTKSDMGLGDRYYIYEYCADHRVRARIKGRRGHFVDPMLKLYYHVPLMLVSNEDVPNGHANGTRVLLEAVVLKEQCNTETLTIDGLKCPSVEATSIEHLVCSLENNSEKIFLIQPKTFLCTVKAPVPRQFGGCTNSSVTFTISINQFPLLVNNATTGHKLQGQTKKKLIISVWSNKKNWNYVALSRVQTRKGLYLIKPLPYNTDFSMSNELKQMRELLSHVQPGVIDWDLEEERTLLESRRRHSSNIAH
jgi:hypothetical protein